MLVSMTGFGRGTATVAAATATVELRSVNSRFLETSIRVPRAISFREADIQAILRDTLTRGRISVQVQLEQAAEESVALEVDVEAARGYAHLLETLRAAAGIGDTVRLEHLLTFSEVFKPVDDASVAADHAWEAVKEALKEATDNLQRMRADEGKALHTDLAQRLQSIEDELVAVEQRAPERVREARERLYDRLNEMLSDERVNRDRLEMEMAILADRLDITEECVRLRSHIDVFRQTAAAPEPAGRKLNFLLQEMNREVNTIGSKANDAAIAHHAVGMKEELERIREQVQNIE